MQSQSNLLYCLLFQCYNYNQTGTAKRTITLIKSVNNSFLSIQVLPILASTFFTQKRRQKNEMRCQTISRSLFHWSFSAHFNWSLERDENYFSFAYLKDINVQLFLHFCFLYLQSQMPFI